MEKYIDDLKKLFQEQNIKMEHFEKIFKPKMLQRFDPTLISNISKKLLKSMPKASTDDKLDLINVSSATSTPINCKSIDFVNSNHNSPLKKRDYKEFRDRP